MTRPRTEWRICCPCCTLRHGGEFQAFVEHAGEYFCTRCGAHCRGFEPLEFERWDLEAHGQQVLVEVPEVEAEGGYDKQAADAGRERARHRHEGQGRLFAA